MRSGFAALVGCRASAGSGVFSRTAGSDSVSLGWAAVAGQGVQLRISVDGEVITAAIVIQVGPRGRTGGWITAVLGQVAGDDRVVDLDCI